MENDESATVVVKDLDELKEEASLVTDVEKPAKVAMEVTQEPRPSTSTETGETGEECTG